MSGSSILLDTNIALYLLNGDKILADILFQKKLYLSFINQLELLGFRGVTEKQQGEISRFINDCIVAATARYLNVPVMTSDFDFKSIKSVEVIIYK